LAPAFLANGSRETFVYLIPLSKFVTTLELSVSACFLSYSLASAQVQFI